MPNQLIKENSPYLRQHAGQPVDWMTWSSSAFEKADRENKPILISIGYSSCHWCQNMSRENYNDSYVAALMNRHFVCILIDREERPDLDQTYMEAIRMFNQPAGWPLHAFCLPDGKPFWGGTFFPKENTGDGIAPWPQVLIRISEHYRKQPTDLIENANNVMGNLAHTNHAKPVTGQPWNSSLLINAVQKICEQHDDLHGGFTRAPKFPSPMKIDFLLAISESQFVRNDPTIQKQISKCVITSLDSMAKGGIFDQLGGGFFRYSMDRKWKVPHFEKLLSDNALLVSTYSRAFRKYQKPLHQKIIQKTLNWMFNEMGNENEGFGSSLASELKGLEGNYYLWDKEELDFVLGSEVSTSMRDALGTIDHFPNQSILPRQLHSEEFNKNEYLDCLEKLTRARRKRPRPELDQKRSASLNALVLRSLVDASLALNDLNWLKKAFSLNQWMEENLLGENYEVRPIFYPNQRLNQKYQPFLDDFVFWAESLLYLASVSEIYQCGSSAKFLSLAEKLTLRAKKLFGDGRAGGYFFSQSTLPNPPPIRKKFWYDNALPSGNSSLLRIFCLLFSFTQSKEWETEYLEARDGFPKIAKDSPESIAHALTIIAEETIGIPIIEADPQTFNNLLVNFSEFPHRPIIVKAANSEVNKLKIKGENIKLDTTEELWNTLYS